MTSDLPLKIVEFGPTYLQVLPDDLLKEYVYQRYNKREFCDFPFDATNVAPNRTTAVGPRASQVEEALSLWYTRDIDRDAWLEQVDKADVNNLT